MDLFHSQTFGIYALFVAGLCVILSSIDMFGGLLLPRPAASPAEGRPDTKPLESPLPQGYARVMAAHRNAMANIIPFILIMLILVLLGGDKEWVALLCGAYTAMRLVHAVTHIRHLQPWRTIFWILGQFCFFIALFQVVRAALRLVSV
jgi:uncharacterized MAPEG superfamily protein